jgi:hypothetical protein
MGLDVQVGHRAVVRATGISPHCVTVCVCEVNNSSTVLDPSYLSYSALTVRVRLCSHDPSIVWTLDRSEYRCCCCVAHADSRCTCDLTTRLISPTIQLHCQSNKVISEKKGKRNYHLVTFLWEIHHRPIGSIPNTTVHNTLQYSTVHVHSCRSSYVHTP